MQRVETENFADMAALYLLQVLGQFFEKPLDWTFTVKEVPDGFEVRACKDIEHKIAIDKRCIITKKEIEGFERGWPIRAFGCPELVERKIKDLYERAQHTLSLREI